MPLAAVMARLRPLTFAVLTGGLRGRAAMFFSFQVLPTTRHPRYSPDDENDSKDGEDDHVEHDSVHHTRFRRVWLPASLIPPVTPRQLHCPGR